MIIVRKLFDFFCGDWRVFWGIALTITLIKLAESCAVSNLVLVVLLLLGISFSLGISLKREISQ